MRPIGLQFITHFTERRTYLDSARIALEGGCRWVQLRMKDADEGLFVATAREVRALCDRFGATFVIDDHAELVGATGADGVHLGKNDMPVAEARRMLGPNVIIGGTANTVGEGHRDIVRRMRESGIALPIVAIGGIAYDDIDSLMRTGVTGIALSGSVLRADDPVAEMRRIADAMEQYDKINE